MPTSRGKLASILTVTLAITCLWFGFVANGAAQDNVTAHRDLEYAQIGDGKSLKLDV